MTQDTVWISTVMQDSDLMKSFLNEMFENEPDRHVATIRRNYLGEPLPQDAFPAMFFVEYRDQRYKDLPDIFSAGGT